MSAGLAASFGDDTVDLIADLIAVDKASSSVPLAGLAMFIEADTVDPLATIRHGIANRQFAALKVPGEANVADTLAKFITGVVFEAHRRTILGLVTRNSTVRPRSADAAPPRRRKGSRRTRFGELYTNIADILYNWHVGAHK